MPPKTGPERLRIWTEEGVGMKGKKVSEEKVIGILKEAEAGVSLDDLARRHGVSKGSLFRWRAKYGGMQVSEGGGLGSSRRRTRS